MSGRAWERDRAGRRGGDEVSHSSAFHFQKTGALNYSARFFHIFQILISFNKIIRKMMKILFFRSNLMIINNNNIKLNKTNNILKRNFFNRSQSNIRKPSFLSNHNINFNGNGNGIIWSLITINLAIFGAWKMSETDRSLQAFMYRNFTISGNGLSRHHNYHTLITSTFSHQSFQHLLFNMIGLWSFGVNMLYLITPKQFLLLYMGGGAISSLCQAYWPYIVPRSWPAWGQISPYDRGLGASGAVNSIVMWSVLSSPMSMFYLYGLIPIPAALFGVLFIGKDAYSLYYGDRAIGNAAHLGGALFGGMMFIFSRGRFRRF
jgi:membrane associated rhomboid family serine protease